MGARHLLTDALGSTLALTDSNGVTTTSYSYEPYGKASTNGVANDNSYQYTGRENDNTGLNFYRARYYNPSLHRFISEDPIGLAGGMNMYAYVDGNPISNVDPYGLFGWADMPALQQDVVDFSAGLGDGLLLGMGQSLQDLFGVGGVDRCSTAYKAGALTSFGLGAGRLAYAGIAKAGSVFAASGAEASAFREGMRGLFRFGAAKNWRPPDLSKYATDDALRDAAGRTNPGMNAYGAGVASAGAACGCPN